MLPIQEPTVVGRLEELVEMKYFVAVIVMLFFAGCAHTPRPCGCPDDHPCACNPSAVKAMKEKKS